MAGKGGKVGIPVLKESREREFNVLETLSKLEALLSFVHDLFKLNQQEVLASIDNTLSAICHIDLPTMSVKNKFHGMSDESAEDLIKKIKLLKLANGWDDRKRVQL
jgi:hypothetical protein